MSGYQNVLVNSGSQRRESLARFAREAERSLSAFYSYVRQQQGERAAYSHAEGWLEILEKQLGECATFPNLVEVTGTAIAGFTARVKPEQQATFEQDME
jgi:hypothetical protein